jgi:mono/diheme cytochrome c family protein
MKKLLIPALLVSAAMFAARGATPAAPAGLDAKAIFADQCAKCHGEDGKGDTKMGKKLEIKDLTDPKIQAVFTDEQAAKAIKEGTKDKTGELVMKPIEGIKDEEIKALIPYIRSLAPKK